MKERSKFNTVGLLMLFLAAVLIIIGILSRQDLQVLGKAVRVCLECIGIG